MRYYRKFLVSNICHIEFIIYIKKFTIVNILVHVPDQIGTLSQVGTSSYMAYAM